MRAAQMVGGLIGKPPQAVTNDNIVGGQKRKRLYDVYMMVM